MASSSSAPCSCAGSSSRKLFSDDFFLVDTEDNEARQILAAVMSGDIPAMKALAKQRKREGKSMELVEGFMDDRGSNRLGVLHAAAYLGRTTKMCKFLINDLHLDVNASAQHGLSPLMCAIYGNAPIPVLTLLLDNGANQNMASEAGCTVLHLLATKQDRLETAEVLLSRKAHVDSMSVWGTPLHLAAQYGNVKMMELLLKYKANPNRVLQIFYAPPNSVKSVELLIKAAPDVNAGRPVTPLVVAATDGLTDCIKCLMEAHADPNIPNKLGRKPVEIAAIHGWKECVEILFPVTTPVARFANWSVDGIMQHVKSGCSEGHCHKSEEPSLLALGNAAFFTKDYAYASALYTKAMETDPEDSTLYAKRCLCWLCMGERDKALDDANTCERMGLVVSYCHQEQGAALIPTEDYGQACDAAWLVKYLGNLGSWLGNVSGYLEGGG